MFAYITYGLAVSSDLALPELLPADAATHSALPDIAIRLYDPAPPPVLPGTVEFSLAAHETVRIRSVDGGTFCVRGGREISVEPTPDADEDLLRLFILGPALAMLLYQRGLLVLHASAVSVFDCGAAFLGFPGQGKSTTAAALCARGHALVADDAVAVTPDTGGVHPLVWPGFPQLKLWPEASDALGVAYEQTFSLHRTYVKRALRLRERFSPESLPLKRLYVLAEGEERSIERLPPQEAVIELVRHSFATRLLSTLPGGAHFSRCAALAKRLAVYRLTRPRDLAELPRLAELVEQDMARSDASFADPGTG